MWRVAVVVVVVGCGGQVAEREAQLRAPGGVTTAEDRFGPLEVGADYLRYRKLTDRPFQSLDHGNRWVDVYVNEVGAGAYLSGAPIPVGTVVVKTSWVDHDGAPGGEPGPIFVMAKRAAGYWPERDDWYFAIHWADPPAKFGGPVYWRGKSPRAAYCWQCHNLYDRHLGGLVSSTQLPR